jgi:hypothetical protein
MVHAVLTIQKLDFVLGKHMITKINQKVTRQQHKTSEYPKQMIQTKRDAGTSPGRVERTLCVTKTALFLQQWNME